MPDLADFEVVLDAMVQRVADDAAMPAAILAAARPTAALASYIDHTLLKADAGRTAVTRLCDEARRFHFASVCVNGSNVALCADLLRGAPSKTVAVVGFPLGASTAAVKAFEARDAVALGAQEIDMVLNVGALVAGEYERVRDDIAAVTHAVDTTPVKVILETGLLNTRQKVAGSLLSLLGGALFVKTSSGFGPGGATVEDIRLMRTVVGPHIGVKASGGIRQAALAWRLIAAGATRLGVSASVALVSEVEDTAADSATTGAATPGVY